MSRSPCCEDASSGAGVTYVLCSGASVTRFEAVWTRSCVICAAAIQRWPRELPRTSSWPVVAWFLRYLSAISGLNRLFPPGIGAVEIDHDVATRLLMTEIFSDATGHDRMWKFGFRMTVPN